MTSKNTFENFRNVCANCSILLDGTTPDSIAEQRIGRNIKNKPISVALFCIYGVTEGDITIAMVDNYRHTQKGKQDFVIGNENVCNIVLCSNCTLILTEIYEAHEKFCQVSQSTSFFQSALRFKRLLFSVTREMNCDYEKIQRTVQDKEEDQNSFSSATMVVEDNREITVNSSLLLSEPDYFELPLTPKDPFLLENNSPLGPSEIIESSSHTNIEMLLDQQQINFIPEVQYSRNKSIELSLDHSEKTDFNNERSACKTPFTNRIDYENHSKDTFDNFTKELKRNISNRKMINHPHCSSDGSIDAECEICKTNFQYELQCLISKDEVPFDCQICRKIFTNAKTYVFHQRNSTCGFELTSQIFNCSKCSKSFKGKYLLSLHLLTEHQTQKANYEESLTKSINSIKEYKDYFCSCDICWKPLSSIQALEGHRQTHKGGSRERFKCEACGFTFNHKSTVSSHRKKCEAQARKKTRMKNDKIHTNGQTCQTEQQLKTLMPETERKRQCHTCGEILNSHKEYTRHMIEHTGMFKCTLCVLEFLTKGSLKRHMENKHLKGVKHVCNVCSLPFYTKTAFYKHCGIHPQILP